MLLYDIKQVSTLAYLAQAGFEPRFIWEMSYWYSPLYALNLLRCLRLMQSATSGTTLRGDHGDIIDLVFALHHCSTGEAMKGLSRLKERLSPESFLEQTMFRRRSRQIHF